VPSRPLLVVHPDRPQVERHHLEAPQAPIPHRGHPLAILGPTEALLALGLLVPCIQKREAGVVGSTLPLPQLRHKDLLDGADLATPVKAPVLVPVHQEVPKEVRVLEDPPVLDSQAMGILHMEDHHQCMGTVARPDHKDPRGLARLDQDNIDLRPGQDPNAKCPLAGVRCTTSPRSLWSAPSLCSTGGKG